MGRHGHKHHEMKNSHVNESREMNLGDWECPHCHRKVHEPNHLPNQGDVDAWEGICMQHEPGCEWIREYAPAAVWKKMEAGTAA